MAQIIHAKNTPDGTRFKLWSTITDSYISQEMDEPNFRQYLLELAVCEAIEQHFRSGPQGIDGRMERARTKGTSSMMDEPRDLNAGWERQRR